MKPRADSILDSLPRNQQEALEAWLFEENLSYAKAQERLRLDFAVKTSRSAVAQFYQRVSQRKLLERITASSQTATAVKARFDKESAPIEESLKRMVAQLAFEMAVDGKLVDPEAFCFITELVLKAQDQELKKQAYQLQRDRFEFDAAKACLKKLPELKAIASDRTLNVNGQIEAIRKQLFGALPKS